MSDVVLPADRLCRFMYFEEGADDVRISYLNLIDNPVVSVLEGPFLGDDVAQSVITFSNGSEFTVIGTSKDIGARINSFYRSVLKG